jgi:hypothetical protein
MPLRKLFQRQERVDSPVVREEMIDRAENLRRQGQEKEAVQVERLLGIYKAPRRNRPL